MTEKEDKQRTIQQNKALHLWFDKVAKFFNKAGLDMRKALDPEIDIPWQKETVKDYLWRPIQRELLGIESTIDLKRKNIDEVYNVLNRHFAEKFKVHIPFPSLEEILLQQNEQNTTKIKR